ncbi:MAG: tripartite tricarboxylate transporter permease [Candidatus Woesearchaeota archaeon]|jgi:putative membrane protein|nr:tripartite tricarboxylate transporter permease [Candidatus Woesearchaeota archaeon]
MEIPILIIPIILGILFGTLTGLIPGLHINMIASLIIVNLASLLIYFNKTEISILVLTMSITHTFVDFIPSIVFGIPSEDTALSVLPAHRLTLEGKAYQALFLSSIGSLASIIFLILIGPIFFLTIQSIYPIFQKITPYLLLITILILILTEKTISKIFWAIIITLFAAGLGIIALNSPHSKQPLLILFSGIFGISTLLYSLKSNEKIPKQDLTIKFKADKNFFKSIFIGGISASFCSITPGIGNSQAATLSTLFFKKINTELFIVTLGIINTTNFILSILTFYLINRARNGAIIAISQIQTTISQNQLILFLIITILISIIAFFLTLKLGKILIQIFTKINQKKFNIIIILSLTILIISITNFFSTLILIASISLGTLCIHLNIKRVHLMNVLIIPIVINLI